MKMKVYDPSKILELKNNNDEDFEKAVVREMYLSDSQMEFISQKAQAIGRLKQENEFSLRRMLDKVV